MSLQFYTQAKVLLYINELETNGGKPVFIEIHPSLSCNHKCVWCRYSHDKNMLTLDQMNAILHKYPTVKGVRITGGGEPLTNSSTIEFIQNCAQSKITVGIETNGELLNDEAIKIIAGHCLYCRISLDAANPATYHKLHGSKHFEKVLDNICNLRSKGIKELGISYLVTAENVREMLDIIDLKLPIDYVHFKPLIQGIDSRTRDLALIMARHWENTRTYNALPGIRYDRLIHDDANNVKTQCRITKLIRVLGSNNIEYICCEKAYIDKFEISKWNGSTRECISCRYSGYNEILEQYYKNIIIKELLQLGINCACKHTVPSTYQRPMYRILGIQQKCAEKDQHNRNRIRS